MMQKFLNYQDGDAIRAERQQNRARSVRHLGLLAVGIGGSILVLAMLLAITIHVTNPIKYVERTTEIRCLDSITGKPIRGNASVVQDGGLDDDANKLWSIGPDETGKLSCRRNVWVEVEITAPGYQSQRLKFDDATAALVIVKLRRL